MSEYAKRPGVEIGLSEAGEILLRDAATGEVFQNIVRAELIVDARKHNGSHALPVLKVTCIDLGASSRNNTAFMPAGVQPLAVTSPVFVEVRHKVIYAPRKRDKAQAKNNRRLHRASKVVEAADNARRLRHLERESSDYAKFRAELAALAETHPQLQALVAQLPAPETASV